MRVIVVYGEDGMITRVAVPHQDAERTLQPRLAEGQKVAEVDMPHLDLDAKDLHQQFRSIFTNYRIKVGNQGAELERVY